MFRMNIEFANLQLQYQMYKAEIDNNIFRVLNNSNYIMGQEINEFEGALEKFTGVKHAIACSSGTDALLLSMMAMDIKPGDEIITTPFTFISTAETIASLKAKPVFVDIDPETFNIDPNLVVAAITNKTRAIMPVSLYGQPADMDDIQLIADKHKLKVIVDGAQSFGAKYGHQTDSALGDVSTTSFFPAKPFGCYGDGGAVFTNSDIYAEKIRMMRVHGQNKQYHHKYLGLGGRLDTIQAAVLLAKLPHFSNELVARQQVADRYTDGLIDVVDTPVIKSKRTSTWAQYTVKVSNRDHVQSKLRDSGIPTSVYYPIPLHLQECFEYLKYNKGDFPHAEQASRVVMSLPMNPFLKNDEIDYVIEKLAE